MKNKKNYSLSSFFMVAGEMIEGKGEDSYSYAYTDKKGFIGVFDGCGGTGSRRYPVFDSHTGAFLASRIAAYTTRKWWNISTDKNPDIHMLYEDLHENISVFKEIGEKNSHDKVLKGSLSEKTFPTTAVIITYDLSDKPLCKFIWAGDSRGYLLDRYGLCQVTDDDIDSDSDAYDNIESDARVNNVINADTEFYLHQKEVTLQEPCLVLAATDGCFSYIHTPMEFEHLLLSALCLSDSIYEWEKGLKQHLQRQASDDYTLAVLIFGFKKFKDIKSYYRKRLYTLNKEYISKLCAAKETGDNTCIDILWEQYKGWYYRYES